MSPLLIALLGVLLVPLYLANWRATLLGLALQGFVMALVAERLSPASTWQDLVTLGDLVLLRGLFAPLALYAVLRARKTPSRTDVIPANLLSWTMALGLALVAFSAAELLVPAAGERRTLVAVATSALLLGFFVLASQTSALTQVVGVLRIENAIALLELGGPRHPHALGVQLGLMTIYAATIVAFRWYVARIPPDDAALEAAPAVKGPTL